MKKKFDIYEHVTSLFIDSLERGCIPWKRPYSGGVLPFNMVSGKQYHGINIMILGMAPYSCRGYVTFKQAGDLGGKVKKGENSSMIIFWKFLEREDEQGEKYTIPLLRYYNVFNLEQCEGIELPETEEKADIDSIPFADSIILESQTPNPEFCGSVPCYKPITDSICLPNRDQFNSSEELYSTVFHEMVHSTGHKTRLSRPDLMDLNGFRSHAYSREELTAEIGSSFLNHHCGFGDHEQENSESYVNGWVKKLKDHKKMIIEASGKAQKAVDYILGV